MKIIATVLLALIPGILSSTDTDEVGQEIRSLCDKNVGSEAFKNVENASENTKNTMLSVVTEIRQEHQNSSDGIDAAITVYCGKVGILRESLDSFVEALIPCLEPGDRELGGLSIFTASLLQFPCANRNLVKDVFNSTDLPCVTAKLEGVVNCGQDILADRNTTLANISSSEIGSDETIQPEVKSDSRNRTCSEILSFQQCTVRVLAECEDQIFSTTLDALYKYTNNELPCENLPKSPK